MQNIAITTDEDGRHVAEYTPIHGCYADGATPEEALRQLSGAIEANLSPEDALARFFALMDHDWVVERYGDHLLVCDTATRYWVEVGDVTPGAIAAYLVDRERELAGEDIHAYTELCQSIPGLHDSDVPAEHVSAARDDLGYDDGECVAVF